MRLLKYQNEDEFSLTQFFDDIPPYAILSHTWGPEEVTFRDIMDGNGMSKIGFDKIRFCGEQARRDGLHYFWVDTCCIDKSSSAELAEAINSMFRWYRDAAKCYVFLSDVPRNTIESKDQSRQLSWESAFRNSRWFTRGWTLQELIASASAEFFSKDRERLGDKKSLERLICEITGIPGKALRGSPLADFSVTERMSWQETRQTTREEDMAYSLLGIFDVYMPLIYSEGRANAVGRLQEAIDRKEKGVKHENFSIPFSLCAVSDIERFVARDHELREIHKALSGDGSRRTVILRGLGGIGKTQLAVAYAKRHKDNYSAIFWLDIKDEDSLKQSFARMAKQISRQYPSASQLSSMDMKGDLDNVIDAIKAWLSLPCNTRWLMIYDNYDNPKSAKNADPAAVDIRQFLPESYQGSVIITTRSSEVKMGHCIQVTKLENIQDSLKILSNTSNREGLENYSDAIRLAKKLDGLPLALATAGAYLDQASISFSAYLCLYEESWAKLQKTSPGLSSYEDRTLYSTWQISFEHVERQNILSAQLLRLWAYFDNQDLWLELLQHSDPEDPDWVRELTEDDLTFHGAMRVLSDHGLVEVDKSSQELLESRGYSIHGCVHSWTVHVLNQEWDYYLAKVAVKSIVLHVPEEQSIRPWPTQRRLLQHAGRCTYMILNGLVSEDGMDWAYHNLGNLYADQGKLTEAEQMYERALRGREKALGAEHTLTLDTVNNLSLLYADQGKLAEAEQMYERALRGYEQALGAEHTSTLDIQALGAEHTSTLDIVNNLGDLYADQGKLAEAEQIYERALRGYEQALGAEHTSTLDTGKLAEAEQMYERALQGYEKALGVENITTYIPALNTIWNLGLLFEKEGTNLVKARIMYSKALTGYEKVFGPNHPKCHSLREILRDL
ncbi:HET-domain-containing protein [Stipitochalara longipes BDJ]|nr:HET-domain-containing protein [Stipitochalara longipes BDJ]